MAKSSAANCDPLVDLFSFVGAILKRLNIYPEVSVISEVTQILANIMTELVLVFGIATEDVKDGPLGESILINKSLSNVLLREIREEITTGD